MDRTALTETDGMALPALAGAIVPAAGDLSRSDPAWASIGQ